MMILLAVALAIAALAALLVWDAKKQSVGRLAVVGDFSLVGKPAPDFNLTDRDGNIYSPESLKGKNAVLFFNEGLICYPACWDEMVALAKDIRFQENNTIVLSVVADSKDDWQKATNQVPDLKQARIIFDPGARTAQRYGMLNTKSSMHQGTLPGHSYVLIDRTGIVRFMFDDIKMGKNGNKLIEEIQKLN